MKTVLRSVLVFALLLSVRFSSVAQYASPAASATPTPTEKPAIASDAGNLANAAGTEAGKALTTTPSPIPSEATEAAETQSEQSAPFISAYPKVVPLLPGDKEGMTNLSWDAGSEHPAAELWVKVDNQDPTRVVKRGKGYRNVKVEAGKTYLYILSDAGKQLATLTVTAK